MGLICGAVGLLVTTCISAAIGLCGPLGAIGAGGVAGFLAVRGEIFGQRSEATRQGAYAGAIAGGLAFFGQLIGGVLALLFILNIGAQPLFGQLPEEGDSAAQLGFWIGGLALGLCLGVIGLIMAAGSGALAAYLASPAQAPAPPAPPAPPATTIE